MRKLVSVTNDEKQLSYYKYYETGLPEIPAEKLALISEQQPMGRGIPFDKKDDFILMPEDKNYCFVGFGMNEDGTGYAANQTFIPGGKPEMLEWWFTWGSVGPDLRYRMWDPEDHYFTKVLQVERIFDETIPIRERVWGVKDYTVEDIGFGPMEMFLYFKSPKDYGFSENLVYREGCDAVICIATTPACVCHKARKVEGGIIIDSYFWVGYSTDDTATTRKLDPSTFPLPLVEAARALYRHNLREMGKLAEILPSIYAEESVKPL